MAGRLERPLELCVGELVGWAVQVPHPRLSLGFGQLGKEHVEP